MLTGSINASDSTNSIFMFTHYHVSTKHISSIIIIMIIIMMMIVIIFIIIIIIKKSVCGEEYSVEPAIICKRGGFAMQRHDQLRNLEAELLSSVCTDVQFEPFLQEISNEQLSKEQIILEIQSLKYMQEDFGKSNGLPFLCQGLFP